MSGTTEIDNPSYQVEGLVDTLPADHLGIATNSAHEKVFTATNKRYGIG